MIDKVLMLAGIGGIAFYFSLGASGSDVTEFPYSGDQVTAMLTRARTAMPRRDGDGTIEIWAAGKTTTGVALKMKYASWAPVIDCQAIITPIAADKSRVVADCGGPVDPKSPTSRTQNQLRAPMFEEHIQATLEKRPFDRAHVDQKETAAVFQNLPDMQAEALKTSAETQRNVNEAQRAKK